MTQKYSFVCWSNWGYYVREECQLPYNIEMTQNYNMVLLLTCEINTF